MLDKNIGVTLEKSYFIKKLDLDYFDETMSSYIISKCFRLIKYL